MRVLTVCWLWLLLAWPVAGFAEDEETPPSTPPAAASEEEAEAEPESGEPVSGEDVWARDQAEEEEIFVPSETVSADSAIAFPADI